MKVESRVFIERSLLKGWFFYGRHGIPESRLVKGVLEDDIRVSVDVGMRTYLLEWGSTE